MSNNSLKIIKDKLDKENYNKLARLENPGVYDFVAEFVELCNPQSVFIRTDDAEDIEYVRKKAMERGEERQIAMQGHTLHFDGFFDQARDKKATKYLLPKDAKLGSYLNSIDSEKGLAEIKGCFKDIMKNSQMIVAFFCLGPVNSEFSILAAQITDSFYVVHSEDILYRPGYQALKKSKANKFFRFVHSAGELQDYVSKNTDKRRIYIDINQNTVYSVNTQYAGNTVGLKKLALRLAINKASNENWLAEHMFVMGISNQQGKKQYFCGAYPSMCGKTSTAMVSGESIVGDDIAYLRFIDSKVCAVNVERGIFGIIKDVNARDDRILFKALSTKQEVIFSNVLIDERGIPFWIGKEKEVPHKGINFAGQWHPGKTDNQGQEIPPSHKNARFTIRLESLENVDENLNNPKGVEVKGLIYGGRDSDTSVPVEESFSWQHGIITKAASLESETTAATLGQEGVRVFNPMSNIDFLSISLGKYIKMNLDFGSKAKEPPSIFSVNYFLRDKNLRFLNGMEDKRIWLKWMRLRVDREVSALKYPTGFIPLYDDLKKLFKEVLNKEYKEQDYIEQFTLRIPENLAKIERIRNIYSELEDIPEVLFKELEAQEQRLRACLVQYGQYPALSKFREQI